MRQRGISRILDVMTISNVKSSDSLQRMGKAEVSDSNRQKETLSQVISEEPETRAVSSIEQDLWKQLNRIQIPVFSGDMRTYQSWKAAFLACIDSVPATSEYELLQLRQCLSGEALNAIKDLRHLATAYDTAKERLERKFGGKRHQIAIYLKDLEKFRQIRPGHTKDLEQIADLLEITVMKLKEAGQHNELRNGSLYRKLQQKLPESMLARYHRWIFDPEQQNQ